MSDNKLTEAQLLFRLQQFHGAELEASEMGDHEFAHECADVASIIREVQEYRIAAGKPAMVVPDGYVMVPAKANTVMIRAGAKAAREYMEEYGGNSPGIIYQAMVAAAFLQKDKP